MSDSATAPSITVNPANLKTDIESGLSAALAALSVVEKFEAFMPAQVKTGLTLLVEVLTFAKGVVDKL